MADALTPPHQRERLLSRNAGFIRERDEPHGPLLPDKSGVPVAVPRCARLESERKIYLDLGSHFVKKEAFTIAVGIRFYVGQFKYHSPRDRCRCDGHEMDMLVEQKETKGDGVARERSGSQAAQPVKHRKAG